MMGDDRKQNKKKKSHSPNVIQYIRRLAQNLSQIIITLILINID